jgi:predicted GNAT family acetyltransferase
MNYTEHVRAETFLAVAQGALERRESANGLMLGIGLRLVSQPLLYGSQPYMATVESAAGLRIAALMTPPHKLQLYVEDEHDLAGLDLVADALLQGELPVPGVMAAQAVADAFASIWCPKTGTNYQVTMRQGIYELRRVVHPPYPPGEIRPATAEDVELVRQWALGFHQDCFGDDRAKQSMAAAEEAAKKGDLFLWVDGVPTSMAARRRPTPHGEAVSHVYTPPEHRRKGYATAVVARVSQRILDSGKQFCTLYTNLANPTSNSIYQKIGYKGVADVVDVDFTPTRL